MTYDESWGVPGASLRIKNMAALLRGRRLVDRVLVGDGVEGVRLSDAIQILNLPQKSLLEEESEDAAYIVNYLCRSGHIHSYVLGLLAMRAREGDGESVRGFYDLLDKTLKGNISALEGLNGDAFLACAIMVAQGGVDKESGKKLWMRIHNLGPDAARMAYHAARFSDYVAHAIAIGAIAARFGHTMILCEHYSMPPLRRPGINEVRRALEELGGDDGAFVHALPYLLYH